MAIARVDYKEAYDLVPHSWIIETLELVGAADNIKRLINENVKIWKTQLTACGKDLGEAGTVRGDKITRWKKDSKYWRRRRSL